MHTSLTYELDNLEEIIQSLLFPSEYEQPALFEYDGKLRQNFQKEVERIRKCFIHEVVAMAEEQHLQRYIHFHQQELIRILDTMQSLRRQRSANDTHEVYSFHDKLHYVIRTLDELLGFIEIHFTRYFDQDTKAPESYIALARSEVVVQLSAFQEELRKHDTEIQLIGLILRPLRKFVELIPARKITYREIIYNREVTRELRKMLDSDKASIPIGDRIRFLFLYLNYNTINYFDYYTAFLGNIVKQADGIPKKMEQLSSLLKGIRQAQTIKDVGYSYPNQSLKEQLIDWLDEEMVHMEKSLQLSQKNLLTGGAVSSDFKMQTDLSLSQLAYLLRIFMDSKLLLNKNLSEVLRFVSHVCQVKGQNISFESFRVRYYNPEESVRKNVRSFLLQLVDCINKI